MTEPRVIREIAADIRQQWKKPYFGAIPYLEALLCLESRGSFGLDSSDEIILRFLANSSAFRGEEAKKLKYELVLHLSPVYQK
jgi:hypothetical protein